MNHDIKRLMIYFSQFFFFFAVTENIEDKRQ